MSDLFTPRGSFISGDWRPSTGSAHLELINPATEETLGQITDATSDDVAAAVASASAALPAWGSTTIEQRIEVMEKVATLLAERSEELARLQSLQMGAPITSARGALGASRNLLRAYIDASARLPFEYLRQDAWGQSLMRREPVGVVAAITPWNFPLATAINKMAPALLAGCSVVLKPAPEAPVELGIFAEICVEAGLPDGVLNILMGGREAGEALVSHPDVNKVTFTGSTLAGKKVAQIAAERFARMSLELGGKSAAIVLDDVDMDAAVPVIAGANFGNAGQACISLSRVLVSERRYDEFVDAAAAVASAHVLGDPLDESTTLGPLVAARQQTRVLHYLDTAERQGAKAVVGGGKPDHLDRGYFIQPTVLAGVNNSMTVAREEIFGPVMCVIPYSSVEEAISIANDSDFGLHGGVFTTDPERGLNVAKQVVTGSITINRHGANPSAPFGGVKMSGVGREHSIEGIDAFCETKTYVIPPEFYDSLKATGIPEA
jgi:aldehyde dehydrogenase (NAD+)